MPIGGLEVFTANLARELTENGNEVGILVFKAQSEELKLITADKVEIFLADQRGKFNFSFLTNVYRHIQSFKPDIILSLSDFTYFFIELLQKLAGWHTPHIIAFHSLKPCSFKDNFLSKLFIFFSKLWKGYYLFVSNNQFILNQAYYNLAKERIFVIHNGIDTNFFVAEDKGIRAESLNIIHIANIRPEKDQWTLIKSLETLNKSFANWKLTFVGKDKINLLNKFRDYLRSKDLIDKVTFFESRERESIKNFLSLADVFVLTSILEVFPIAALEAMAMGLACILTDVGGCSEIVKDGYNGYLVKPKDYQAIADKLLYLYKNRDLLKQMGENARKTVLEKFNIEACAEKYLEVFTNIVKNAKN